MSSAPGILLCGVAMTIENSVPTPIAIGAITSCTGFGASRNVVPNIHNDLPNGWAEVLVSCIKQMKPFRVGVVHNTNSIQWKTWLEDQLRTMAITWPVEAGYTTGAVDEFEAAVSDYEAGATDIEGRVNATFVITPSGELTHTNGTPA